MGHRARYDEIAGGMGCFKADALPSLKLKPLQQVWRDHLLAGCLMPDESTATTTGSSRSSTRTTTAARLSVDKYGACLVDARTFVPWTLEQVVGAVRKAGAGKWIGEVEERYLAFEVA